MKQKIKDWLKAAGVRALKTSAQAAVASLVSTTMITDIDWRMTASTVALAAILSLLMSIVGLPELSETGKSKKSWIIAILIRAARTFAQSLIATIGTTALFTDVNWNVALATAAMSAILSIATSLAGGIPEADPDDTQNGGAV